MECFSNRPNSTALPDRHLLLISQALKGLPSLFVREGRGPGVQLCFWPAKFLCKLKKSCVFILSEYFFPSLCVCASGVARTIQSSLRQLALFSGVLCQLSCRLQVHLDSFHRAWRGSAQRAESCSRWVWATHRSTSGTEWFWLGTIKLLHRK